MRVYLDSCIAIYRTEAVSEIRERIDRRLLNCPAKPATLVYTDLVRRERRAMERLWKEREKQIARVIANTVGMYGEMSGILGASMPEIPALTLEAGLSGADAD